MRCIFYHPFLDWAYLWQEIQHNSYKKLQKDFIGEQKEMLSLFDCSEFDQMLKRHTMPLFEHEWSSLLNYRLNLKILAQSRVDHLLRKIARKPNPNDALAQIPMRNHKDRFEALICGFVRANEKQYNFQIPYPVQMFVLICFGNMMMSSNILDCKQVATVGWALQQLIVPSYFVATQAQNFEVLHNYVTILENARKVKLCTFRNSDIRITFVFNTDIQTIPMIYSNVIFHCPKDLNWTYGETIDRIFKNAQPDKVYPHVGDIPFDQHSQKKIVKKHEIWEI